MQIGSQLSDEGRRAIYPELLKRLDDSSNKVSGYQSGTVVLSYNNLIWFEEAKKIEGHLSWLASGRGRVHVATTLTAAYLIGLTGIACLQL